jgi:uncharacterized protein
MDTLEEARKVLMESRTIAVVGCSRDPSKAAHQVPKYLKEHGYRIIPVNPSADEILGEKVYKTLSDIGEQVDIVDVFRPGGEAASVALEAVKLKPRLIWLQKGVVSADAERISREAGVPFVSDRCMMVEHMRIVRSRG